MTATLFAFTACAAPPELPVFFGQGRLPPRDDGDSTIARATPPFASIQAGRRPDPGRRTRAHDAALPVHATMRICLRGSRLRRTMCCRSCTGTGTATCRRGGSISPSPRCARLFDLLAFERLRRSLSTSGWHTLCAAFQKRRVCVDLPGRLDSLHPHCRRASEAAQTHDEKNQRRCAFTINHHSRTPSAGPNVTTRRGTYYPAFTTT